MTLGAVVMLAVVSTYLYLGRSLTRLSYHRALEVQSRSILITLAADVRKAKSVTSASNTSLSLQLIDGSSVTYSYASSQLTRNPGSGAVSLLRDISGQAVQAPVTMTNFTFSYYSTFDNTLNPAADTMLSIKQVAATFTLQAGGSAQQASGVQTQYGISSGRILIRNKLLPTGP
jgi:hypothetical protein